MKPIAALFLSLFASIATLCAQSYSVDWYTIDGGGGDHAASGAVPGDANADCLVWYGV
jgi:hypothetical protein